MWLSWWLMLVVDCCDDCSGPKAATRCLPDTVRRGGWRLVDIIVVGCYAYSTLLKIVLILRIAFFSVIAKSLTLPNFFFSSMGSKKALHPLKNRKRVQMVFRHFLVVHFSSIGIARVDSQVGCYWALSLSSPSINFAFLILFILFHVTIFQIYNKLFCLKLG